MLQQNPNKVVSAAIHGVKRAGLIPSQPLTGVAGFEPAHSGVKDHCLTAWRYPTKTSCSFSPLLVTSPNRSCLVLSTSIIAVASKKILIIKNKL